MCPEVVLSVLALRSHAQELCGVLDPVLVRGLALPVDVVLVAIGCPHRGHVASSARLAWCLRCGVHCALTMTDLRVVFRMCVHHFLVVLRIVRIGSVKTFVPTGMCPASAACRLTHLSMDAWSMVWMVVGASWAGRQYQLLSSFQVSGSVMVHPSLWSEAAAAVYGPLILFHCIGWLFAGSVFQSVRRVGPVIVRLYMALARAIMGRV